MSEPIDTRTVGTCGNCGGPVVVPTSYMSVNKPVPTCTRCGSVPKTDYGPVLPMEPRPKLNQYGFNRYDLTDWETG